MVQRFDYFFLGGRGGVQSYHVCIQSLLFCLIPPSPLCCDLEDYCLWIIVLMVSWFVPNNEPLAHVAITITFHVPPHMFCKILEWVHVGALPPSRGRTSNTYPPTSLIIFPVSVSTVPLDMMFGHLSKMTTTYNFLSPNTHTFTFQFSPNFVYILVFLSKNMQSCRRSCEYRI